MLFLYELCWSFGLIFVASELCQRISSAFDEIDYEVDQLSWYLFPIEIWRMLPMIIMSAQEPITFECFGSISCERITFKNVSKIINFLSDVHTSNYLNVYGECASF